MVKRLGHKLSEHHTFYEAVGCRECRETGYQGRMGIFELITVDERLREAISNRGSTSEAAGGAGGPARADVGRRLPQGRGGADDVGRGVKGDAGCLTEGTEAVRHEGTEARRHGGRQQKLAADERGWTRIETRSLGLS